MKYTDAQIMKEAETRVFKRLITEVYPGGVVSIVSDTFDFWHAITEIAPRLKEEILNRVPDNIGLAKVVFRPDSGDPVKILCGYKWWDAEMYGVPNESDMKDQGYDAVKYGNRYYKIDFSYYTDGSPESVKFGAQLSEPEVKGAVECLWDIFSGTVNNKGYRTLNQRVGLIYGDSITPQRTKDIMEQLMDKGFASDNVVLGIGSFTFQYQTRDSLGFAMKATYVELGGVGMEIFKDPKTDSGMKKSAKGLLRVSRTNDGELKLYDQQTKYEELLGELVPVFENGKLFNQEDFATIRERLANQK